MHSKLFLAAAILLLSPILIISGRKCFYPGHGLHTRTNMTKTTETVENGTEVTYHCDPGFEMFGTSIRTCQFNGSWSGEEPVCAMNVARHRQVIEVSSFVDDEEGTDRWQRVLDDFYTTCSVARNTDGVPSFWSIDLLQQHSIVYVKVAFGEPSKDLQFKVMYSNGSNSRTPLPIRDAMDINSVFVDFEYGAKETTEFNMWLKHAVTARYISIHIPPHYQRSRISLCEVAVYSATASSAEQCRLPQTADVATATLESTCYSFHRERKLQWKDARLKCKTLNNGSLLSGVTAASQEFLRLTLRYLFTPATFSDVFWVGGHKRREFEDEGITPIMRWINETTEKYFVWNKHDTSGIGDALESCLTISGPLNWMWTTKQCHSTYPWICQYRLPSCGMPDQQPISLMEVGLTSGLNVAEYSCPDGYALEGAMTRSCLPSGQWTDIAPWCRFVDCGQPEGLINGTIVLLHGTTTYGSAAEYSCAVPGLHLIGPANRVCQREGKWSGEIPFCSDVLPDPEGLMAILNMEVVLSIALACLGVVVLVTVITLCVVFFKKRSRRLSLQGGRDSNNILARFDSDGDLGPADPEKNGLIMAYGNGVTNGKA